MANKRKKKASKGPRARKVASKRIASVYEARTGGDTIHRAAGSAAHEDAARRGGLEASEGCRDRALQERDESRALAADAELGIGGWRCENIFFRDGGERVLGEKAQA